MKCELCERDCIDELLEQHHLLPGKHRRVKKNRKMDVILVCPACGDQIHLMHDSTVLRDKLDSLEALKESMKLYIAWIRTKPIEQHISMKKKKRRK